MKDRLVYAGEAKATLALVATKKKSWAQDKGKFLRKAIPITDLQWTIEVR